MKKKVIHRLILYTLAVTGFVLHGQKKVSLDSLGVKSFKKAEDLYEQKDFKEALSYYDQAYKLGFRDSTLIFEKAAFCTALLNNPKKSTQYITQYLKSKFDLAIFDNTEFNTIRESNEFQDLEKKFFPKVGIPAIIYLVISLLGFLLGFVLIFKINNGKASRRLIGLFVLLHSIFIVHVCLYITNYRFEFPHILFVSASFSYLYGPLVYFYFKRATQSYEFDWIDLIHLVPFILYILKTSPLYLSSSEEKLLFMLNFQQIKIYDFIIMSKVTSLILYGVLVVKLYKENLLKMGSSKMPTEYMKWQKAFIGLYMFYVLGYVFYVISVTVGGISQYIPIHVWLISMSLLVLIVGYFSYMQPKVLDGSYTLRETLFFKYKNSGLTPDFSNELKTELELLMVEKQLYSDQSLSLETVSEELGTTRHNTSQIINEHFNMNFFEFVNLYRIEEAKKMLLEKNLDNEWKYEVIDVLFHVGFNNRMTFNKAFKKATFETPTQFRENFKKRSVQAE